MKPPITGYAEGRVVTLDRPYPEELLDKLTSYYVPGYRFMPRYNTWKTEQQIVDGVLKDVQVRVWDGKNHKLQNDQLPLGLMIGIQPQLEEAGYQVKLEGLRNRLQAEAAQMRRWFEGDELWDSQVQALERMILTTNCGGLILSATGTGKTRLAAAFFQTVWPRYGLFIVDELTLMHQAREELGRLVEDGVGLVGESRFEPQRVTVATIQTLWLHRKRAAFKRWFERIEFVIIDEIHVQMNRRNFNIVKRLQPRAVYGLTATLEMKRAEVRVRAYAVAGPVIYTYPLQQGIEEGHLTPIVAVKAEFSHPSSQTLPRSWRLMRARYQELYEQLIVRNKRRNDVLEKIVRDFHREGKYVILLVDRIMHLKILYNRLIDLNPKLVYGRKKSEERLKAKQEFEQGETRLIVTNRVFQKGVDIKRADVGIQGAAGKSRNNTQQFAGRLARLAPDKPYALVVDLSDLDNRFEQCTKARMTAYRRAKIPIVTVTDIHQEGWVQAVERQAQELTGQMELVL